MFNYSGWGNARGSYWRNSNTPAPNRAGPLFQFGRFNANTNANLRPGTPLPDGVRLEPVDTNTINLLSGFQNAPAVSAPQTTPAIAPKSSHSPLEEIMQDERNASVFYKTLSETAYRDDYRSFIQRAGSQSAQYGQIYNPFYIKTSPTEFQPKAMEIHAPASFDAGLNLAIVEEGNILDKMTALFESTSDERLVKTLFSQICRKLNHISRLHLMCLNKNID